MSMMIKLDPSCFLVYCQNKVLTSLERIAKDKESYVRHCMKVRSQPSRFNKIFIAGSARHCWTCTSHNIQDHSVNKKHKRKEATHKCQHEIADCKSWLLYYWQHSQDSLKLFPIILHLMTSPFIRVKIFTAHLVEDLSFYLANIEELTFLAPEDFKSTLLLILEAISQVHY
jgi:hypothetical protein